MKNQFWKEKYPKVFTGKMGKLKNYQLKFHDQDQES